MREDVPAEMHHGQQKNHKSIDQNHHARLRTQKERARNQKFLDNVAPQFFPLDIISRKLFKKQVLVIYEYT
jgi:hypothetical protein